MGFAGGRRQDARRRSVLSAQCRELSILAPCCSNFECQMPARRISWPQASLRLRDAANERCMVRNSIAGLKHDKRRAELKVGISSTA